MRVALYGGSFDPPHRGHLAVAQAAARTFALQQIFVTPTGKQPLKLQATGASYADRFAMVELLCEEMPDILRASALDAPHPDGSANYTVDLLAKMEHAEQQLFCIVGADSFLQLRQWKEPDTLLKMAEWIVVSRPGFSLQDCSALQFSDAQMQRVHLLEGVHWDISATEIRDKMLHGEPSGGMLTPAVEQYIHFHALYTH